MYFRLLFLPVIGALIGWLTNWIAIKLIFKPYNPYRVPVLGIVIQGLLPRRKNELARSVGAAVEEELLPPEQLVRRVEEMRLKEKIETALIKIVNERLEEKLRIVPISIRQGVINYLQELLEKELDRHLDQFLNEIQENVVKESNLGKIVEEQISNFDFIRLEELVFKIVSSELRHIEILGGVLGFLIGVVQALVLIYV